jgi:hypothetical protein
VHRKAGGEEIAGKIQERAGILEALVNNPLTRSWQGTMDRFVTGPIGRKMASDEVLAQGVADMVGGLPVTDGRLHPAQIEALNTLAGRNDLTGEDLHRLAARRIENGDVDSIGEWITNQALTNAQDNASRETLDSLAEQLSREHGGRVGLTELGSTVRQFGLGSPVAAYAAVGGSSALLVKGAMDVYARMQAGEPVSEEEAVVASKVLSEAGVK